MPEAAAGSLPVFLASVARLGGGPGEDRDRGRSAPLPAFPVHPTPWVDLFRYTFLGPSFLHLFGDPLLNVTNFFTFVSQLEHQLECLWVLFSMLFACFCLASNFDRFWDDLLSTFRCPEPCFPLGKQIVSDILAFSEKI